MNVPNKHELRVGRPGDALRLVPRQCKGHFELLPPQPAAPRSVAAKTPSAGAEIDWMASVSAAALAADTEEPDEDEEEPYSGEEEEAEPQGSLDNSAMTSRADGPEVLST